MAALLALNPATAADVSWLGGSGNWSSASSWLGGVLPSFEDVVRIDAGSALASTVTIDDSVSVQSLLVGSNYTLNVGNGQSFSSNAGLWNSGNISVSGFWSVGGGILNDGGTISVVDYSVVDLSGGSSISGGVIRGQSSQSAATPIFSSGQIGSSSFEGSFRVMGVTLDSVNVRGAMLEIQGARMAGANANTGVVSVIDGSWLDFDVNASLYGGLLILGNSAEMRMQPNNKITGVTVRGNAWGTWGNAPTIYGGKIEGGSLEGIVRVNGGALDSVSVIGMLEIQGARMAGGNTNTGVVSVGDGGWLDFDANASLDGGMFILGNAAEVRMQSTNRIFRAAIRGNSWGNAPTIYGGKIEGGSFEGIARVSGGTIDTVTIVGALEIQGARMAGGSVSNGVVSVIDGSWLDFDANASLYGGMFILGNAAEVRMQSSNRIFGAAVRGNTWGDMPTIYGGKIEGGSLDGMVRVNGVVLDTVYVQGGALLEVQGAAVSGLVYSAGELFVRDGARLDFAESASLFGGRLRLGNAAEVRMDTTNRIDGATVRGESWGTVPVISGGSIGFSQLQGAIRLQGVSLSDATIAEAASIRIASGDTATMSGLTTNRGTIRLDDGSSIQASGEFNNTGGLVDIGNGSYVTLAAGGTFHGGVVRGTGTAALRGDGTYRDVALDGTVAIQGGTFQNVSLASSMQSLTVVSNGTLDLSGQTLTQAADSRMVVNGSLVVDTLTIEAGVLQGSGTIHGDVVNTGGVIAAGNSPGKLSIDGDLTLGAGSLVVVEAYGLQQGVSYDWLSVVGNAHLGGKVRFDFGYGVAIGDTFTFLSTLDGAVSGTFDNIYADGYRLGVTYGLHDVSVSVTGVSAVPEPRTWALMFCGLGVVGWLGRRRAYYSR